MEQPHNPMRRLIFVFISIVSAFLFLANYVVYSALAAIFTLTSPTSLHALALVMFLLSGGFIAASIMGSYYYNAFTRKYYLLTAVWMGTLTYLFLFSALYGILIIFFGPAINTVGQVFIVVALLMSLYAFMHARNISVKEVGITLAGLPESWRGRRIVWVSDLHLGQIRGQKFTRKVVDMINAMPHDVVFIGGDLYDGTQAPDLDKIISPFTEVTAPLGVYFITGNHEEFGDSSNFLKAIRKINIRTLIDEKVEVEGLQIIGVDYHNAANTERFKNILAALNIDRSKPSILLKHEPRDLDVAQQAGINFQISGHTHRAQLWPLEYAGRLIYKHFVYGLHQFESMQVFTSSGTGTWGPPMRLGTDCEMIVFTLK